MNIHYRRCCAFLILCLCFLSAANMHAQQEEPRIGMEKSDVLRMFGTHIFAQSLGGNDVTLRIPFCGYPANVFVGFQNEKATFISVSYTSFLTNSDQTNRLTLFRDIRKRLQILNGSEYAYARIDDIDVLGESGGWISDKRRRNALVFGKKRDGLIYHLELFAESLTDLATSGEVSMTVVREDSVQLPTDRQKNLDGSKTESDAQRSR